LESGQNIESDEEEEDQYL
jgi:hypothetical protein